jgi:psp operon transcriptional activator
MISRDTQILGEAPAWLAALERVSAAAQLDRPFLIIGERGTGKELVAERAHYLSPRWEAPLIKVNCAALSESLLDSELFGHEAGAFTGATKRRAGRFELADGGTLFLDEIATAALSVQEKLLRIIEYGEFQRLGGEQVLRSDVRVVAATNEDLPSLAQSGQFRADLLDRLAFDVVTLPPMRARQIDIPLLAEFFAQRLARELDRTFEGFAPSAHALLLAQDWPGNVRELKNVAERATYRAFARGERGPILIDPDMLDPFASPFRPGPQTHRGAAKRTSDQAPGQAPGQAQNPDQDPASASAPEPALPLARDDMAFAAQVAAFETALVDKALRAEDGHQGRAAERLGLSYHQFRGLLKKYGYGRNTPRAVPEIQDGPEAGSQTERE